MTGSDYSGALACEEQATKMIDLIDRKLESEWGDKNNRWYCYSSITNFYKEYVQLRVEYSGPYQARDVRHFRLDSSDFINGKLDSLRENEE